LPISEVPAQWRDLEVNVDCYRIPLPNGRVLAVYPDQLRRIARGLGDHLDQPREDQDPPIVEALRALPADRRADAFNVAVLRFGEKQDVETIAHHCDLSPWRVWELEERFRHAVAEAQADRASLEATLRGEMTVSASGFGEPAKNRRR
jgi:hypothetical protein